ncbi:MAG: Transcriptional regulator, TetR family [Akkermansiaceae bacterium]|nr:Transcriptional regulator, TetR family [Akkermansiaceae bacterium]
MAESTFPDPGKRDRILDRAFESFLRFGFRKTSMDEVARAAAISRQGLYLYFENKEALFRSTMEKHLSDALTAVEVQLARTAPLEDRLKAVFDIWFGSHAGAPGLQTEDLLQQASDLVGDLLIRYRAAILSRLEAAIAASPLAARLAALGLEPMDAARTLHACGLTWKRTCANLAEFAERMAAAIRLTAGGTPAGRPSISDPQKTIPSPVKG